MSVDAARREASTVAYVLPFAVFMVLLAAGEHLAFLGRWDFPFRAAVLTAVLLVFSRHAIDWRIRRFAGTVMLGVAVFVIWIAPDVLIPGYRDSIIFQNPLTGSISTSIPESLRTDPLVLISRSLRAIVLVPIIEELFWRGWLIRWLIRSDFRSVPIGAYTTQAMIISAVLFASEHGAYWDVGLAAGLLYNWWVIKTKSLGDCILAHAITNACLSAYVLVEQRWEYWL